MKKTFAVLILLVAVPLSAQFLNPQSVILQTGDGYAWTAFPGYPQSGNPLGAAVPEANAIPIFGPGRLLLPTSTLLLFHDRHTMASWNLHAPAGEDYFAIFTDDAVLTDIVPLRSGHFLVASNAKLIEFDLRHKIAEIPFEGADHIEVLADGCTLLYTNHDVRVRRMNLCTHQQEADFATLVPGQSAGALRQMANGDVIVAVGTGVLQFRGGSPWTYYVFDGVTHIALSTDGTFFWAAGIQNHTPVLRQYDPAAVTFMSVLIGWGQQPQANEITDLAIVGEWRAGMTPPRARAVRHR